jgi:hypothetical protein
MRILVALSCFLYSPPPPRQTDTSSEVTLADCPLLPDGVQLPLKGPQGQEITLQVGRCAGTVWFLRRTM